MCAGTHQSISLTSSERVLGWAVGSASIAASCFLHSTYPVALDTALGVLLLIARHTDRLLVTWYERLDADWLTTNFAAEALLMKLFPFELVLLHPFNIDVGDI